MEQQPSSGPAGGAGKLSTGDLVAVAGGAVTLIGSFLNFYKVDDGGFSGSWGGWSDAFSLMPLIPIAGLIAAVIAVSIVLERLSEVSVPATVLGQPRQRVDLIASALVCLTFLTFTVRSIESIERGIGAWVAGLASIALVTGVVLRNREHPIPGVASDAPGAGGAQARTPGAYAMVAGAAAVLVGSFLDVYGAPDGDDFTAASAWEQDFRPITLLPVLLALVAALPVVVALAGARPEPTSVAGQPWSVVQTAVAGWAAIVMISFLIGNPFISLPGIDFEVSREIGFWVMLAGSVAVAGGAVARRRAPAAASG